MELSLLKATNGFEQRVLNLCGNSLGFLPCGLGLGQEIFGRSLLYGFGKIAEQCSNIHFAGTRVSGHGAFLPASFSGSHDPFS
jgi:hypothetical protein